jgi:DNA-binding response OmpR family regulator
MRTILIVDNDAYMRDWLREILLAAQYDVAVAPNGRVALQKLRAGPTDLVITEMLLPEMDGVETIVAIRHGFPETKIIAITGGGILAPRGYLQLARALGVDRAMAKPFTQSEMLDSIHALLRKIPPPDPHL